jgi:hypothetical protein
MPSFGMLRRVALFILMMEALRSSETPFLQESHNVTTQKTAFFNTGLRQRNYDPTCVERPFIMRYNLMIENYHSDNRSFEWNEINVNNRRRLISRRVTDLRKLRLI